VPRIPIFPLDVVLFPGEPFGLHMFEERYLLMAEVCLAEKLPIGVVLAKPDQPEGRVEYEPEQVGTAARIVTAEKVDDRYLLDTVGTHRFRIRRLYSEKPYQEADVEWLAEPAGDIAAAAQLAEEVLEKVESVGGQVDWDSPATHDPVAVSHVVASRLPFDLPTKQRLLEAEDAQQRLEAEAEILDVAF
jgi:uncharacterized protein